MSAYNYGTATEVYSGVLLLVQILPIVILCIFVLMVIAWGKLFAKAGLPWERVFVPYYGAYWQYKVAGAQGIFWTNLILSVVFAGLINFVGSYDGAFLLPLVYAVIVLVLWCIYCVRLAKSYGKGGGFAVGLIFLPFIFIPILGFGKAVYVSPYWKGMENYQQRTD